MQISNRTPNADIHSAGSKRKLSESDTEYCQYALLHLLVMNIPLQARRVASSDICFPMDACHSSVFSSRYRNKADRRRMSGNEDGGRTRASGEIKERRRDGDWRGTERGGRGPEGRSGTEVRTAGLRNLAHPVVSKSDAIPDIGGDPSAPTLHQNNLMSSWQSWTR